MERRIESDNNVEVYKEAAEEIGEIEDIIRDILQTKERAEFYDNNIVPMVKNFKKEYQKRVDELNDQCGQLGLPRKI